VRLAKALEDHDLTRTALAEGRVNLEQTQAILRAVGDLPEGLDPELIGQAEAHLIDQAQHFDAKALKHLGRHLLEVIDPDTADAHTAKLLDREERAAAAATRLAIWDDAHGKTHGRFTLDRSGEVNFFVLTDDPSAAMAAMLHASGGSLLSHPQVRLAARLVGGEDYKPLWPVGDARKFQIT
jgi:hypothetical protein